MTNYPSFFDVVRSEIRVKHYSIRTEKTYISWIKSDLHFYSLQHPRELGAEQIEAFLTHLAVNRKVSASTQNQALSALLFPSFRKSLVNPKPCAMMCMDARMLEGRSREPPSRPLLRNAGQLQRRRRPRRALPRVGILCSPPACAMAPLVTSPRTRLISSNEGAAPGAVLSSA